MSDNRISMTFEIPLEMKGLRLDQALTDCLKTYSRARIQTWIESGEIKVNGGLALSKLRVSGAEKITLDTLLLPETNAEPENLDLNIVYEDPSVIVLNKPAGCVVHPGAGVATGTLLNALLYHYPELQTLPRGGIVHRLDKDTTGLMVVAHTLESHAYLVQSLQDRIIKRNYQAMVNGVMTGGGTVTTSMGRDPKNRLKRAVLEMGKEATTHYRIMARFRAHTHVECELETGRTHQIRVHMQYLGYPILGDPLYGGGLRLPKNMEESHRKALQSFKRQALHAASLSFNHPKTHEPLVFKASLPQDMQHLLEILQKDSADDSDLNA